ncbi:hypothetical protein, partial [Thomasclavelia cocleata]
GMYIVYDYSDGSITIYQGVNMKKLAIISDIICLIGVLFMLIIRIQDSEMWYKAIMAIIALIVSIRLIYDIKKSSKDN